MAHTGIRLRLIAGGQIVLEGDSDWLHMNAQARQIDSDALDISQLYPGSVQPPAEWHQIGYVMPVTALEIWVQPVMLEDP